MSMPSTGGFFLDDDQDALKRLFGEQEEEQEEVFATIRTNQIDTVAKRAPQARERELPSFPQKEQERDIITFAPKRPKGAIRRMIQERLSTILIGAGSLGLLAGTGYVVLLIVSNYN